MISLNKTLTTHKSSGDHDSRYYTKDQVNEKNFLKILKSDWSANIGTLRAFFDANTKLTTLGGEVVLNDGTIIYSPLKAARVDADADGNDIPTTYLKKSDGNNLFNTDLKQVTSTEFNKYFGNTWSYAGPNGLSIDDGTWLVSYYAWFSANTDVTHISIKSTRDEVVGTTAISSSNGTFLQMHEILSGCAISNLLMYVYVPSATTFGQFSSKIRAIKLR